LPVFFYIDPEFATDRNMRNIDDITLSYVFFKTGEVPKNLNGTELTPGESMPAELLPSAQAAAAAVRGDAPVKDGSAGQPSEGGGQ
jgi:cytochrome c oxidase assembly protein subunit 11